MSLYVVDASVAAKWFLIEVHHQEARRIVDGRNELHAPDLFLVEMDNVLCKRLRRGEITAAAAGRIRGGLRRSSVRLRPFGPLLDSAYAIAAETGRGIYDCLYVALAALVGGPMVTADRRLYDALAGGPYARHVLWIEEVP